MSGLLSSITLSVWILKSQTILFVIFLDWLWCVCVCVRVCVWVCVCVCVCVYHLSLHCMWYFWNSNQCTKVPTLSCRFLYWFLAKIEHSLTMCVILSVFSLQSLHSGVSLVLSLEYLMALTRRPCFWAAHKRLSVLCLSSPRFSHFHLFPSSMLSVSLKNWSSRAFSFNSIRPLLPVLNIYKL